MLSYNKISPIIYYCKAIEFVDIIYEKILKEREIMIDNFELKQLVERLANKHKMIFDKLYQLLNQ